MYFKTVLETPAKQGVLNPVTYETKTGPKISELVPMFLKHGEFELSFSPQTVFKYGECLHFIIRDLGDLQVPSISLAHVTELKQKILMRGAGDARVSSMVFGYIGNYPVAEGDAISL